MSISQKTQAVIDDIKQSGDNEIYPMFFYNHSRASVSAGFRVAKKRGIIEVVGIDGTGQGNPLISMNASTL